MRRASLQAELLLSLALVMMAASTVLAVVLFLHEEARLRDLLARSLLAEAQASPGARSPLLPGTQWWKVWPDGTSERLGTSWMEVDPTSRSLARTAHENGAPVVLPGAPWHPIRFAAPHPEGSVFVARLPENASWRLRAGPLLVLLAVLVADVLVFAGFGVSLLRRRVVLPLRRLAGAARAIADGAFEARVPVEGPRESAEVAAAFNEMTEALERRTGALEKAVVELRDANRDLRQTREGLARAQRLAAVGRLAAGVAHEVGNPIGAILAFIDLASRDATLSPAARQHLERAAEQGERVRSILRRLLEFSRPPQTTRVALDVKQLAEEAVNLVGAQRRYQAIRFAVEAEDSLPVVCGDPAGVAQILLNLTLNAADAVRDAAGASVRVVVRGGFEEVRDGESRQEAAGRRSHDAVECVVADNGHGVAEEDRDRIFDPFFTTKPPGEGTGLGLANSARLAEELGGTLDLGEPPPGFRTAFVLRLPCDSGRPPGTHAGSEQSAGSCEVRSGLRGDESDSDPAPQPIPQE